MQTNDIGFYEERKCTDDEKYYLLKNRWMPEENYNFPVSSIRNLKFQRSWLLEFPWLVYSIKHDAAFCQYCYFFAPRDVGKGSNATPKNLVTIPFRRWKDAKDVMRYHQTLKYHKDSMIFGEHFIEVREKKIVDISLKLDSAKKAEIERNRQIYQP